MPNYFYVAVRTDIPLADQLCQIAHVCADAGREFQIDSETYLVLLQVKDENELCDLANLCDSHGIKHQLQYEPDDDLGRTALCTEIVAPDLRKYLRQYHCWKPPVLQAA